MEQLLELITQGGSWIIGIFAAGVIGRQFIAYIKSKDEETRELLKADRAETKAEKERLFNMFEGQRAILEQQKDMLVEQMKTNANNTKMLEKLTDIQMLHTNRLDRMEDRQSRLEDEIKKIGDRLR